MNTAGKVQQASAVVTARQVVLVGNPNCGKTTVFNALTGLRAKVGNYPGVTVERKEGKLRGSSTPVTVLDLPGAYSLSPQSVDEQIARDVLFHRLRGVAAPDLVVVVVDASNLQRNLYFATQVLELGYPTLIAMNMSDVAAENGIEVDAVRLSVELGARVIPTVGTTGAGLKELREEILRRLGDLGRKPEPGNFCSLPGPLEDEVAVLSERLRRVFPESRFQARAEAILILSDERFLAQGGQLYPEEIQAGVVVAREALDAGGVDWRSVAIEARYNRVAGIQEVCTRVEDQPQETVSDRLDRLLTHRVWGLLIFVALMALVFQSIFSFAELPMNLLERGVSRIGELVGAGIEPGPLHSLLVDGVIAGVGAVVVFLPQICLLFFFIGLMEDTGYMPRAAFIMDRLMSKVGLHGKSFIPLLSSFACAIPGIMAARTIENPKDRLATILVAPLMSCSARLPVYTLLIAACVPDRRVLGVLDLRGLTMLGMYGLGIGMALLMAWLFKRTFLKSQPPMLILELPAYKRPLVRTLLRHMWDRSKIFLRQAGTVILGINILLWFLASYPKDSAAEASFASRRAAVMAAGWPGLSEPEAAVRRAAEWAAIDRDRAAVVLQNSFAGRLGRVLEPVIAPLGFDWKMGIGIVASFAAREVFVSTMSLVYSVGESGDSVEERQVLAGTLRAQTRADGSRVYTTLVGLSLMVFYVFALQCVSTIAVVRRETNSWRWPLVQWLYMGALAWVMSFLTYQGGRLLGWG